MDAILRGTTPSVILSFDPEDLSLATVTAAEFCIQNLGVTKHTLTDLTIDTEENTLTYAFTEAETADLCARVPVVIQARFWIGADTVVGILPIQIDVADMLGV